MSAKLLAIGESDHFSDVFEKLKEKGKFTFLYASKEHIYEASIEHLPDYILVDSTIFLNNGIKGLMSLKQDQRTIDIPVVLATEEFSEQKLKEYYDYGISDFIFKPIKAEELLIRLKSIDRRNEYLNTLYRENEQLKNLSLVAKNTANAVVIFYPNGEIEWENEGFRNMYGYTLKEYLKTKEHDIFSQESKHLKKALKKFENGTTGISFEHAIETKDEENKWIQTTLTPIFNEQGDLVKIVAVESDITDLREEKKKSDELLLNILPFEVAEQLKKKGRAKSRKYRTVTVLFADFKNFTGLTNAFDSPKELISELNLYVKKFDEIIGNHFIEKIKTIGDAYMCAGGLPLKNKSNPIDVTLAGLEIQKYVMDVAEEKIKNDEDPWYLRLGINTGEVMAGVIGNKKFAYDIWGKTVNKASRMEETGEIGKVNVSGNTYEFIKDYFDCTYRGRIKVKNIHEEMDMYFVNRLKPEYSEDEDGIYPNAEFRKILAKY
jgi:PAS domain S-box-containing protein